MFRVHVGDIKLNKTEGIKEIPQIREQSITEKFLLGSHLSQIRIAYHS